MAHDLIDLISECKELREDDIKLKEMFGQLQEYHALILKSGGA